jgi:hypothetical protein
VVDEGLQEVLGVLLHEVEGATVHGERKETAGGRDTRLCPRSIGGDERVQGHARGSFQVARNGVRANS